MGIVYRQGPRLRIIPWPGGSPAVDSLVEGVSGMGVGDRGGNDLAPQVAQLDSLWKIAPDAKDRHQRSTTGELSALGSCGCLRVAGKEGCEQLGRTSGFIICSAWLALGSGLARRAKATRPTRRSSRDIGVTAAVSAPSTSSTGWVMRAASAGRIATPRAPALRKKELSASAGTWSSAPCGKARQPPRVSCPPQTPLRNSSTAPDLSPLA